LRASAFGGSSSIAPGGTATGGTASISASEAGNIALVTATLAADATGGAGTIGARGRGGSALISSAAGSGVGIAGNLSLSTNGLGGAGSTGAGGLGGGGISRITSTGGAITVGGVANSVVSNGTGGQGATGGEGDGGSAEIITSGGGSISFTGSSPEGANTLEVVAQGVGGVGLTGRSGGGFGGSASISTLETGDVISIAGGTFVSTDGSSPESQATETAFAEDSVGGRATVSAFQGSVTFGAGLSIISNGSGALESVGGNVTLEASRGQISIAGPLSMRTIGTGADVRAGLTGTGGEGDGGFALVRIRNAGGSITVGGRRKCLPWASAVLAAAPAIAAARGVQGTLEPPRAEARSTSTRCWSGRSGRAMHRGSGAVPAWTALPAARRTAAGPLWRPTSAGRSTSVTAFPSSRGLSAARAASAARHSAVRHRCRR
jgi:hypothetical protein